MVVVVGRCGGAWECGEKREASCPFDRLLMEDGERWGSDGCLRLGSVKDGVESGDKGR